MMEMPVVKLVRVPTLLVGLIPALRRFGRNRRGSTAVEFALVAPIFLVLLCGILENALILFTQSALDNATRDAARMIMLGNTSETAFSNAIASDVGSLVPSNAIRYNVQSGATFQSLDTTLKVDGTGNIINKFSPGGAKQDVLVRVGYTRPYIFPLYSIFMGSKSQLLVSVTAMQSEPY
jgi:Flp pilus assembly pilin Flp